VRRPGFLIVQGFKKIKPVKHLPVNRRIINFECPFLEGGVIGNIAKLPRLLLVLLLLVLPPLLLVLLLLVLPPLLLVLRLLVLPPLLLSTCPPPPPQLVELI
jgi:hypothetical protein